MAWENLPTNYQDAAWEGSRKFLMTNNSDGTVSFEDRTDYTQIDRAYRSANDVNATNEAINTIMDIFEGSYKLLEPTNVDIRNGDAKALITWTDPENGTREDHTTSVQWAGTLVVRKKGSPPAGYKDESATVVVNELMRNQYRLTPYVDNDLTNGDTYYYGFYPYTREGKYTDSYVKAFTPSSATFYRATVTVTTQPNAVVTGVSSAETVSERADSNGIAVITTNYIDLYKFSAEEGTWVSVTQKVNVILGTDTYSINLTIERPTIVDWATGSDSDIAAMVAAADNDYLDLTDYWHVGDTRTVRLPAMTGVKNSHSQQYIDLVLMNRGGKELTTPTASGRTECMFVVGTKDCLIEEDSLLSEGVSSPSSIEWKTMSIRNWLNTTMLENFSSDFRSIFKLHRNTSVSKVETDTVEFVDDYLALFASPNVFKGTDEYDMRPDELAHNDIFEYYQEPLNRRKRNGKNGTFADGYWFRDRPNSENSTDPTDCLTATHSSSNALGTWYVSIKDMQGSTSAITSHHLYGISFYGVI